ncbi:MAG: rod shape-determining protein MreC [Candidatus Azambacteria bacterium]|nr:rod shape-determining protein MreC [Candidatus Azambacteria bacterium]
MKKSELTLWFFFLFLTLLIIFFGQSRTVLLLKNYLSEILKPVELISDKAGNWLFFWQNTILNIKNIKEANTRLLSENLELYNKLSRLSLLEEENNFLRERANLAQKNIFTSLADVIGRDFQNNRSFLIDIGTNDGIAANMIVISKGKTIIGRIANASYSASKVQTLLDTQTRIAAVTTSSNISGLVRGLGSSVIFDLIAKNKKPEIGELIISSGTDGIWPKGFVVGKIKEITSGDNEVFNTASIELLAEPQDFNSVFVITNIK